MWYWVRPLASYFLSRLWNIPRVYSHFSEIWKATFNTSVKNTYPWGYCSRPLSPALAPNPFPLQAPAPQPGCKGPRRAGGCRRVGRGSEQQGLLEDLTPAFPPAIPSFWARSVALSLPFLIWTSKYRSRWQITGFVCFRYFPLNCLALKAFPGVYSLV